MSVQNVSSLTDLSSVSRINAIDSPRERAEAVATQLESVFMGMMVKAMRETVPEGGLMGRGLGGSHYIEMLDQHLAQLNGLPRDPRFHEALVRQIMDAPEAADAALGELTEQAAPAAAEAVPATPLPL